MGLLAQRIASLCGRVCRSALIHVVATVGSGIHTGTGISGSRLRRIAANQSASYGSYAENLFHELCFYKFNF
jgi:hypothetical protein